MTTRVTPVALVGPSGHQYAFGPFGSSQAAKEHLERFPDNGDMNVVTLRDPLGPNGIIAAAVRWVERIQSRPGQWADDEDFALIAAVQATFPAVTVPG